VSPVLPLPLSLAVTVPLAPVYDPLPPVTAKTVDGTSATGL
jgi:hypothetical protein